MYEEGQDKIDTELDIVKMMKTLRDMKILLKGTLMNDVDTKFSVKHAAKNILNMDDTSDIDEHDEEEICSHNSQTLHDIANGKAPPKNLRQALAANLNKSKKQKKLNKRKNS